MATAQGVSGINLLPKDSFEFSVFGKTLKWATSVGRVLVVLTEFVVLLAFASRFYFDKKLADLNEVITQKQAQIGAYVDIENQMRKVLVKEKLIDSYLSGGLGFSKKISDLQSVLPVGTSLDSLSLDKKNLSLAGRSLSEFGFAQFIAGIKSLDNVSTVNLRDTSFGQITGEMKFSIQVTYK